MKKFFTITTTLLILLSIFFKGPEITSANSIIDIGEVTASSLNVREQPSTASKVIGGLRKGEKISIYEKTGSWYKTKVNHRWGYVHSNYIKITNPPVSGTGEVTASKLNVREQANTSSKIIGSLSRGAKINFYGKSGNWYKVQVNGNWGFIHGDYVKVTSVGSKPNENKGSELVNRGNPTPNPPVHGSGEVTASKLNVREQPSTSSKVIGSLSRGVKIDYYGKNDSWYKVQVNGNWGYVHGDYVKVTKINLNPDPNPSPNPNPDSSEDRNNDLNTDPNSDPNPVTTEGDKEEDNADNTPPGDEQNQNGQDEEIPEQKMGEVTASRLNVRENSDLGSKVIGSLMRGTRVQLEEKIGDWYQIKFKDRTAYVHSDYILLIPSGEGEGTPDNSMENLAGKWIFLDPGHGGYDTGAIANGVEEKVLNLMLAQKIKSKLESYGATVIMSRMADQYVSLNQRVDYGNESGADIFISIHMNSWSSSATSGVEVFYDRLHAGNESRRLAAEIQQQLVSKLGLYDRKIKEKNFRVIRNTTMPSALVEFGFISNLNDLHVLQNEQDKIVEAVCEALHRYFK